MKLLLQEQSSKPNPHVHLVEDTCAPILFIFLQERRKINSVEKERGGWKIQKIEIWGKTGGERGEIKRGYSGETKRVDARSKERDKDAGEGSGAKILNIELPGCRNSHRPFEHWDWFSGLWTEG